MKSKKSLLSKVLAGDFLSLCNSSSSTSPARHIINSLGYFSSFILPNSSLCLVLSAFSSVTPPMTNPQYVSCIKNCAPSHGFEPWLDEEELYPGQDWNMEIEKAVEAADAIIVCLSKGSITKEGYVQRELRTVLDFADYKPEGTLYIIPVRLEECEPPRRLRAWQYADYFEGQRERAFQRLLVSLKRRADGLSLMEEEVERKQIEEPKKEIPAKPFTKLLAPSSLSSNVMSSPHGRKQSERKSAPNNNLRWLGIGGIILFALILGGFGLNYLIKNLPVATATVPSTNDTPTFELATSTNVPFTSTPQPTETPVPVPTLGIGSTMIGEKGEMLVYVPAGEFTMGSDADDALVECQKFRTDCSRDWFTNEEPPHTVYLDAFWIDQTEVTNKQYQACVDAGTCEPPSDTSSYTHPSYYGNPEFDNYPVIYVNWDKANRYCEVWAGGDLPTEAQWEKAARGTDERTYPWGNDAPNKDLLNYNIMLAIQLWLAIIQMEKVLMARMIWLAMFGNG